MIIDDDDDDKQDNDSGIQNDEKEEEEEKILKKKDKSAKKASFKTKSPKKTNSNRSKSPSKNILSSPEKSPKKRRKKFPPKPEKKDHDGTIAPNPHFDAERTAQRWTNEKAFSAMQNFEDLFFLHIVNCHPLWILDNHYITFILCIRQMHYILEIFACAHDVMIF